MFKINWKNQEFNAGEITGYTVQLFDNDNNAMITELISKEDGEKSDNEVITAVLNAFYRRVYPNRAENERFAEVDEKLAEMNKSIAENRKLKVELETVQAALLEFMTGGGEEHETEGNEGESEENTGAPENV